MRIEEEFSHTINYLVISVDKVDLRFVIMQSLQIAWVAAGNKTGLNFAVYGVYKLSS
jgi:hypothetical protein